MRPNRAAFTLIELAVVLAILAVSGAAMGMLLIRQQRFYRGASELLYAREGVRDALEVLASDLRGISIADTVRLLADSAIEIYASTGSSVVCQTPSAEAIGLPPAAPSGNTLTAFLTEPDTGDLVLIYRVAEDVGSWERHRIGSFSSRAVGSVCPSSSGFTRGDAAGGLPGFLVTLDAPLSPETHIGAPVRFIRRGRYSLYRASDGEWYLGYRRCNAIGASSCGAVQPLSGPYRGYSRDASTTGLLFEYLDGAGKRLDASSSPLDLARVDITARTESRQRLSVEGRAFKPADSATISIAVRNRLR